MLHIGQEECCHCRCCCPRGGGAFIAPAATEVHVLRSSVPGADLLPCPSLPSHGDSWRTKIALHHYASTWAATIVRVEAEPRLLRLVIYSKYSAEYLLLKNMLLLQDNQWEHAAQLARQCPTRQISRLIYLIYFDENSVQCAPAARRGAKPILGLSQHNTRIFNQSLI